MKLKDWLVKEDLADPLVSDTNVEIRLEYISETSDSLHVIGTCGDCKYWAKKKIPVPDFGPLNKMMGEYPSYGNCSARNGDSLYDSKDGCIHFEAKVEK